jgi:hypothetical protein
MADRIRSRYSQPVARGRRYTEKVAISAFDGGTIGNHYVFEFLSDSTMPRPYTVDHTLLLEKTIVQPSVVSGSIDHGPALYGKEFYSDFRFHPLSANESLFAFTAFDPAAYKVKAMAAASPYRAKVSVPLFLFELREFPDMLRQIGRVLTRKYNAADVAGGYLAYSFGWAPLVKDLMSLFDLTKAIEDRKAYFRRLESGTHVVRNFGTTQVRTTSLYNTFLPALVTSKNAIGKHVGRLEETQKVWATLNAKLREPLHMSAADLHSLSRNQILGLRFNPADFWEAIPWSWLIDYFLNIGDMLESSRAQVGLKFSRINVMCTQKIVVHTESTNVYSGLTVKPGFVYRTRKSRYPYLDSRNILSRQPFFTGHMDAILSSLVTAKALKAMPGLNIRATPR